MMHGRRPISHLWPLNHLLPKVDISDPHTFLAIKRGILQYAWLKPILAFATIIMKATNTYQEGYIDLHSGYFWSGLIYNVSISVSLYALAMFWVCMSADLQPFRPMPKFLCVKGIIFASYWQGFFLSILVWLGAIPGDVPGYTPDNLAAAIQDALICFEMPAFALAHWYAFSWHDYADDTISSARLPVKYALRDAFGPKDLIVDAKETFDGKQYEYRYFDANDNVIAHEQSSSRKARMAEGMRYARDGKGKYWLPKAGEDSRTPLLAKVAGSRARAMSPGGHRIFEATKYGTTDGDDVEEPYLDPDEEHLYTNARALEFGDWNVRRRNSWVMYITNISLQYPVITAHTATRFSALYDEPNLITASSNRHVLQPTAQNRKRREHRIKSIQEGMQQGKKQDKGKQRSDSSSVASTHEHGGISRLPVVGTLLRQGSQSSSSSGKTDRSQLVDLVVEDHEAEQIERVRARKEGGPQWNETDPRHYVRAYPPGDAEEAVQEGSEPYKHAPKQPHGDDDTHNPVEPITTSGRPDAAVGDDATHEWSKKTYGDQSEGDAGSKPDVGYGSFHEERDAWGNER